MNQYSLKLSQTEEQIFTVSQLTQSIRFVLEQTFDDIFLTGEISNFKSYSSGHWYFNLKDENALITCVMWKGFNNYVFFKPQDGMKVILRGRITVYPPRGNYQFDTKTMKPAGEGELQAAFERLKRKLFEEGLFDEIHKKPIPSFPKKIGIVTSIDGAAIRDMISVAARRYPLCELILAPCKVQGSGSAEEIVESIKLLNKQKDIDVIIVARGGGSIEDLWSFNEEIVARAIFDSKIPIITGVGHEIDYTIADFVADLRAPTPSVAMELATPDVVILEENILYNLKKNYDMILDLIDNYKSSLFNLTNSFVYRFPLDRVRNYQQKLDTNLAKLSQLIDKKIYDADLSLKKLYYNLKLYDINNMLNRGFALILQENKFVKRKVNLNLDKSFKIKFYDGEIELNQKQNG
ncbi:MAG: exodeoxyribonuclease VII large subunit [Ignavibacterium sp.]|nr:exodeoxyribonuclease VII large subunit [Ignavibacterium sp.]MDW8374417.1 exodeoxyribonuclease VII large subunit [Ignavibacteriales bacterium]